MSQKNYDNLAKEIIDNVGGVENINGLTHCVTRLRFVLKDDAKANEEQLKTLKGVLTIVKGNGQFQVVIGNAVGDVFDTILRLYPIHSEQKSQSEDNEQKTGNVITRALNKMAAIVNPIVPALAGAGMIKALLVILTNTLGVMDASGSTYAILSAAGNSVFYFLPLFLAYSSAKAFDCNPYVGLAIVAALLEPNFVDLMQNQGDIVSFLNIPVVMMKYSSTFIPAIVSVLVYSKFEKILKKFIPKSIELFALPFIAILITVPLTMIVIGPVGVYLADAVAGFVNFMATKTGLFTGLVIGAGWTILVMFGIHWGVVPIMVNNIAQYGFDYIRPMVAAATFASAGAAFGVFLKSKDKETKAFALSTTVPALLGGVTEPIVYGISLRYKKPLIAQIIGGGIAGAFMGAMHTKAIVYVFPALTTLPAFICNTFVYYIIGICIAFFVTAAITYFLGINEDVKQGKQETKTEKETSENKTIEVHACAKGEAVALEKVNDETFASKCMGEGIGIIPDEGVLYAPVEGKIAFVFPTKHAVGIETKEGIACLMHIGIDTVSLNGEGFESFVEPGQDVKQGDKLIQFDKEKIIKANLDPTIMLIVTEMDKVKEMRFNNMENVNKNDIVFTLNV